jgi:hypothetical protein
MKVNIIYSKNSVPQKYHNFYHKFIIFLQRNHPLKKELTVKFLTKRINNMTTGSRIANTINVLTKLRLNRDILRTVAHEWIHEYQIEILNREVGREIGGVNEDEANAISGKIIKLFEKQYPEISYLMYESVT